MTNNTATKNCNRHSWISQTKTALFKSLMVEITIVTKLPYKAFRGEKKELSTND